MMSLQFFPRESITDEMEFTHILFHSPPSKLFGTEQDDVIVNKFSELGIRSSRSAVFGAHRTQTSCFALLAEDPGQQKVRVRLVMMASKEGKVTLQTSSGRSRVEVLTYGATVIAWQYNSQDILFLSKKATLDGSAAIRGGIPIVFPVFGSPKDHEDHRGLEKLPKHGFARTTTWKVKESNAESAVLSESASLVCKHV